MLNLEQSGGDGESKMKSDVSVIILHITEGWIKNCKKANVIIEKREMKHIAYSFKIQKD